VTTYGEVLRQREMKAVFLAHAVSLTGSVAAEVALAVLVYSRTSSPFLSSLTLACAFVPQAVSALLLSGRVDRYPSRGLLVSCDLACALVVSLMVVPHAPVGVLLLLAACAGLITPLFMGARSAMLADVLDAGSFVTARSMLRVLSQSALLTGFAVGGLALAVVGPRTLLVVDALSFVASAALLRWGTTAHPARSTGARPPAGEGLRATLAALRHPVLRRMLLLTWLPAALFAPVDALATPYAGGRGQSVGLLLAAAALGTILGEWAGVRLRVAQRPRLVLPLGLVTGVALLTYATHPPVAAAVLLNLMGGAGGVIGQWVDHTLVEHLPPADRGRLFSLQGGFLMAVQGLTIGLAGALAEVVPAHAVLAASGGLSALTALVLLGRPLPSAPFGARDGLR
jgi:predicted MFS family arabinose efflux permease